MINMLLLLIFSSLFLTIQNRSYDYVEATGIIDPDETTRCVSYDIREKEIKLSCRLAHLSDIYNQLNDRIILNKEGQLNESDNKSNIWLLNAGIVVERGYTLIDRSKRYQMAENNRGSKNSTFNYCSWQLIDRFSQGYIMGSKY